MGLFDRFRKRVTEVASETDTKALSAEENSAEARVALQSALNNETDSQPKPSPSQFEPSGSQAVEDDDEWEDLEKIDNEDTAFESDDEWDDFDEEEDVILPVELSRKDRKRLDKERRAENKRIQKQQKAMKKRGAVDMKRPEGSQVD